MDETAAELPRRGGGVGVLGSEVGLGLRFRVSFGFRLMVAVQRR